MNKIISSVIIFSCAFVFLALGATRAEDEQGSYPETSDNIFVNVTEATSSDRNPLLRNEENKIKKEGVSKMEKIPAPQYINYFQSIKRIGNALWGVKKESKDLPKKMESATSSSRVDDSKFSEKGELEKIPTAKHIELYKDIVKKGTALWGIKKQTPLRVVRPEDSACVISSIETKDSAVVYLRNNEAKDFSVLVASRTSCQKDALASVEKQGENLKNCAENFKEAQKKLRENTNKLQQGIWQTYKQSLKACSVKTASGTDTTVSTIVNESAYIIEDGDDSSMGQSVSFQGEIKE